MTGAIPYANEAKLMRRHMFLFGYLTVAAFLVAHLANVLLAETLFGRPPALSARRTLARPAPSPQANPARMADEILSGGLFAIPAVVTPAAPRHPKRGAGPIAGGPVVAKLDAAMKVKLVGTVVTEWRPPFAVIEDLATRRQTLYLLLETIPGVGAIAEIRTDAILLEQGGIQELLGLNAPRANPPAVVKTALAKAPPPVASQSHRRVLDQREVARSLADLPKLLSQARVGPVYANGKVDGWKVAMIAPKSFYERIGLQTGDVLKRVNGVAIRDPAMVLSLLQQLKDERSVSLDMLRGGRKTTMQYEIR